MMSDTKRPTNVASEELLDKYFPVLDYGFIALKDYMGLDTDIERAARVSYQAGTRKTTETCGLIRYLMKHAHTSPFEMCEVTLHVGAPIVVMRQWVRHRTASLNEYSGRYSLMPMLFYTPNQEQFTPQSKMNKQGREAVPVKQEEYDSYLQELNFNRSAAQMLYQNLTSNDVARELARLDLPLSTYTYWYWKIDLKNLLHFLKLRADSHAQWEIRQYANIICGMIKRMYPITFEAWQDFVQTSITFTKDELLLLMDLVEDGGYIDEKSTLVKNTYAKYNVSSRRDKDDFWAKVRSCHDNKPAYELDISCAKDGSYYEQLIKDNTPNEHV